MICRVLSFLFCILMSAPIAKAEYSYVVKGLVFLPDNKTLVEAGFDGQEGAIRFWSVETGSVVYSERLGWSERVNAMAGSGDGDYIAVSFFGADDIGCYSVKEKKWIWRAKWKDKSTSSVVISFSSDNQRLIVVGRKYIVEYAVKSGIIIKQLHDEGAFTAPYASTYRLAGISSSGKYAAFWKGYPEHHEMFPALLPKTKWIVVWDLQQEKIIADWKQRFVKNENCSAAFTPDEKYLFLGSMDGVMRKWSIEKKENVDEWKPFLSRIETVMFSSKGRFLAMDGSDASTSGGPGVKIRDMTINKDVHVFRNVGGNRSVCEPYPMAFSKDESLVALKQENNLCLYETSHWNNKWCKKL